MASDVDGGPPLMTVRSTDFPHELATHRSVGILVEVDMAFEIYPHHLVVTLFLLIQTLEKPPEHVGNDIFSTHEKAGHDFVGRRLLDLHRFEDELFRRDGNRQRLQCRSDAFARRAHFNELVDLRQVGAHLAHCSPIQVEMAYIYAVSDL